ncbi:MAG: serine hydrolase [Myxococcales bacterium]|nr:serine hydrolase [Myxococcales bacterium]
MTRALLLVLAACACRETVDHTDPIAMDDPFRHDRASGDELARIEAAAAYSEAHGGRAFMVLRGDTVVYEAGQNGYDLTEPHHLFSGTKSFSCAAWAVLQRDGLLAAEDDVRAILPGLSADAAGLTVDQVLHLTSGVKQDFWGLTRDGLLVEQRIADKGQRAIELPFVHRPGEVFGYGSADYFLFGEIVQARAGRDALQVLEDDVFAPIGLRTAGWQHDPVGNPMLPYGAWTTAGEWLKYGALVRDDGMFMGERVLPAGALHGCLEGSEANPAYGRTFWLNRDVDRDVALVAEHRLEPEGPLLWNDGPADLVAAAGHQDQRLYIVPSLDLVVARLSDGDRKFRDAELLELLLATP